MELNLAVLAGRLAAPPEVRTFDSGSRLIRYLVTVRRDSPPRRVDVLPITRWDPDEDTVADLPAAGARVWVAGTLQRRFWPPAEGGRSRLEIIAYHVDFRPETDATAEP